MAAAHISSDKEKQLADRMTKLGILETDLEENFIAASGKGGQKVNKTASCVQLRHLPSGTEVRCQKSRSQASNRYFARRDLCDKIEEAILGEKSKKQQEIEKIRRQKRRRSRRAKQKMLDDKKHRSEVKSKRKHVDPSHD
jgi:protein subunit release factor B